MSIKNKRDKLFPVVEFREGGLYSCPYPLNVRDENFQPIATLEHDVPFVVLSLSVMRDDNINGTRTVRILSTEGIIGTIFANPRHIKDLNIQQSESNI